MKILVPLIAAAGLGLAPGAFATDIGHQEITLRGVVGNTCSLPSPMVGAAQLAGNVYTFDGFTQNNGSHESLRVVFTFPAASCNFTAKLGLQSLSQGMKPNPQITAPGFANTVNYRAVAQWGNSTGAPTTSLDTSVGTKGDNNGTSTGPLSGDLNVTINTLSSGNVPLIATGSPYVDTLVIQIGQAL